MGRSTGFLDLPGSRWPFKKVHIQKCSFDMLLLYKLVSLFLQNTNYYCNWISNSTFHKVSKMLVKIRLQIIAVIYSLLLILQEVNLMILYKKKQYLACLIGYKLFSLAVWSQSPELNKILFYYFLFSFIHSFFYYRTNHDHIFNGVIYTKH